MDRKDLYLDDRNTVFLLFVNIEPFFTWWYVWDLHSRVTCGCTWPIFFHCEAKPLFSAWVAHLSPRYFLSIFELNFNSYQPTSFHNPPPSLTKRAFRDILHNHSTISNTLLHLLEIRFVHGRLRKRLVRSRCQNFWHGPSFYFFFQLHHWSLLLTTRLECWGGTTIQRSETEAWGWGTGEAW